MSEMTPTEKKEFYKRFDTLDRRIDRILGILETDDAIKQKGLVEKVSNIQTILNELLTREKIYKAKATTWGIIGGAIGTAIIWVVKILLTKLTVI